MTPPKTHYKRRNKLPNPKFQLQWIGTILGFCALALIVQTLVVGAQFASAAETLTAPGADPSKIMNGVLLKSLLIAAVLVMPALAIMALQRTFLTAGPLYRFEQHLSKVARGEWPDECKIRQKDDHKELCGLINAALAQARQMEPLPETKNLESGEDSLRRAA